MSVNKDELNLMEGIRIKNAIDDFYADQSTDHLVTVMALLSDSLIWILCRERKGNASGEEEEILLEPDILRKGDEYFLPVFTSREEMGERGEEFTKIQQPFTEAIVLARDNPSYHLSGIVVNPFTVPLSLSWDFLNLITGSISE